MKLNDIFIKEGYRGLNVIFIKVERFIICSCRLFVFLMRD